MALIALWAIVLCFQDVESKLGGLNPADLRLEPLGMDRNGSKYWYFFGVR